jgi:hypothetical protein
MEIGCRRSVYVLQFMSTCDLLLKSNPVASKPNLTDQYPADAGRSNSPDIDHVLSNFPYAIVSFVQSIKSVPEPNAAQSGVLACDDLQNPYCRKHQQAKLS